MEYFETSRRLRDEREEEWAMDQARYLYEPGYSLPVKKEILARLASIGRVSCYRHIEEYMQHAEEELEDWALLALNESRMHLESKILEENQVFISTGLGGKDGKLRYFVALFTRGKLELSRIQQKVIENEFDFIMKKHGAEVEEINYSEYLATVLLLLPMNLSLKAVFQEAIDECNQYGNFLMDDFIVTNVKTLSFGEIKAFLERKKEEG